MKSIYLLLFVFSSVFVSAQVEDAWVYFKDKPNATTYLETPLLMLTQRALDRRSNQNIALDTKDIPIAMEYVDQIKAAAGITYKAKSKWLNAIHVQGTSSDITLLLDFAFVDKIDFADRSLNIAGKKAKNYKTSTINKKLETKVDYGYGTSQNQIHMLNGDVLHQQNYTGSGKIIAVLDAGFPGVNTVQPFARLRDNNQILGGYNYVLRDANFYTGDSHGTSVLSTMGGYTENALVGTAPDATYYLFVTEDNSQESPVEESYWAEAAETADSLGVDIITTSLGYSNEHTNPAYDYTYADMNGTTTFISRAAEIAFSKGMLVVASAGNEGNEVEPHISAPADAVSVLAIGAVNASKTRAYFSSIGPSYDQRIKPDVMAQGLGAVLSDELGAIRTASGTSFSCPIIAGMLACLWQANPSKSNQEMRQLLLQSADKYTTPTPEYGYGIPDFSLALANGQLAVANYSKKDLMLYPNPTSDAISIVFPQESLSGMLTIYTILGEKIFEKEVVSNTAISLKAVSSGMYLYQLKGATFTATGKIIKQ